jgi:hypothetical protein
MKLNTLFLVWAVVGIIFGLGFFLVPAMVMAMYGPEIPTAGEIELSRLLGASYLGFTVLAWLTRSITDTDARRKIVLANLVITVLSLLLFLKTTLIDGASTGPNWFNVVLMAVFVVGFGYFYFTKRD